MSLLFPNMASLANSLTPSIGGLNTPFPSLKLASIVNDAKSKAKQLESKSKEGIEGAKDKISSEADALRSKVASATGVGAASKASIELYSTKYYTACAGGGVLACGLTHALLTPLDLVKCRRQVDKTLYKGNMDGWSKIYNTGIGPTWVGYSVQGACKYGFYEYFKKKYADAVGPVNAVKYKDAIYLAGSASAELIADAAYVPLEAVKVRMQTTIPPFATGMVDGFWSFEATVTKIYASLGKPKDSYNKLNAVGKEGSAKPTVGSIYKEIGFGGLWAGLGTRIVMIGTLTALQWLIYDHVKVAFGLPTTGSAEPQKK
ncbi:hypothetical protein PtB15_1B560 [Puccinia triticina]|nr:hypothetical protein PtB15_1B560 [Puccinia triticina]